MDPKTAATSYNDDDVETIVQLETSDVVTMLAPSRAALIPEAVATAPPVNDELPEASVAELVTDENDSSERFDALCAVDNETIAQAREAPVVATSSSCEAVEDTVVASYGRPEFIYVRVIKPKPGTVVGLGFQTRMKRDQETGEPFLKTTVRSISDDGLFGRLSSHYLRPGDEVISVNNVSAQKMDADKIAALLKASQGTVSLTVRNAYGDPRTVASSVQKPTSNSRIGISVRSNTAGTKLKVSLINTDSLFANSLLVAGHRCLEINGHSCKSMLATGAAECLRNSGQDDMITIVSRSPAKREPRAVVLCSEPQPKQQTLRNLFRVNNWSPLGKTRPPAATRIRLQTAAQ